MKGAIEMRNTFCANIRFLVKTLTEQKMAVCEKIVCAKHKTDVLMVSSA